MEQEKPDPTFDAVTARLLHREALRRAAQDVNTTFGPGLESVLARISAEATAEAADRVAHPDAYDQSATRPPAPHPSKP
jgi:hypothetical protein